MTDAVFGHRVRTYRLALHMSQKDLAATVGRSHSMISGIESGTRQIHVDELVTFAKALHVPASALLGDTDGDLYCRGFTAGWAAAMGQARDFALSRMFQPDIRQESAGPAFEAACIAADEAEEARDGG